MLNTGYHTVFGKRAERSEHTGAVEAAALALSATDIDASSLHHVGTPVTFQMHLGTFRPWLSREAFREIAASESGPFHLAVDREPSWLEPELVGFEAERVFRWPEDEAERRVVEVFRISR